MILIIGGAWQGKLEFAKATFGITDADVFTCTDREIDFSKELNADEIKCCSGIE